MNAIIILLIISGCAALTTFGCIILIMLQVARKARTNEIAKRYFKIYM